MRVLFRAAYLRRYLQLRPGSRREIAAWLVPIVAARLSEGHPREETQPFLEFLEKRLH